MSPGDTTQLLGIIGDWISTNPEGTTDSQRALASQLIFGGSLAGVRVADVGAPELAGLDGDAREVLAVVRAWAFPGMFDYSPAAPRGESQATGPEVIAEDVLETSDHLAEFDDEAAGPVSDAVMVDGVDVSAASFPPIVVVEAPSETNPATATSTFANLVEPVWPSGFASTHVDEAAAPTTVAGRTWRRRWLNEEVFYWGICLIAVAILVVRRFIL